MFISFFLYFSLMFVHITNNLAIIKVKTFYPKTSNMAGGNNNNFTSEDYVKSIVLSQMYFELMTGNETSVNQILNIFTKTRIYNFAFEPVSNFHFLDEKDKICNYSIYLSNTCKEESSPGVREEIYKMYTDVALSKYVYMPLKCYNEPEDAARNSLCAMFGIDSVSLDKTNFIPQIIKNLNSAEKSFTIQFSNSSSDEGVLIIGDLFHDYLNKTYNENDLVSIYSKISNWEITMDSIIIEGSNISSSDFYDYIDVIISTEYDGLIFSEYYVENLYKVYFNEYFNKNICKLESVSNTAITIITCDANKFGIEDIKKFPKIIFTRSILELYFSFDGEDLFDYRNNKYYFRVYKIYGRSSQFIFGKLFLKKYITIFNPDGKKIYFYKNKKTNNDSKQEQEQGKHDYHDGSNKWKILIIILLLGLFVFLVAGIYIGKIIYQARKKKANELDDNYLYDPNINIEKGIIYEN